MTGECNFDKVNEKERCRIFKINDFCKFISNPTRNTHLPHNYRDRKNFDFTNKFWKEALEKYFRGGKFKPQEMVYGELSYKRTSEEKYSHPKDIYKEYDSQEENDSRSKGLLRIWDFSKSADAKYVADDEYRKKIAGREQKVLSYISDRIHHNNLIYLRAKTHDSNKLINYWEVFEKNERLERFSEYRNKLLPDLSFKQKIDIVCSLISNVADLHRADIIHRDISQHSVWVDKQNSSVCLSHFCVSEYDEEDILNLEEIQTFSSSKIKSQNKIDELGLPPKQIDTFCLGILSRDILSPPENPLDSLIRNMRK